MKRKTASVQAVRVEGHADIERFPVCPSRTGSSAFDGHRMSDYEFMMSLRIRHPRIDPADITLALRIEPQHTWRAGDARRDSAGTEVGGTHRESYWMGRLMAKPELARDYMGVESEILRMLGTLRRSFEFFQRLREESGSAELHVSVYAREEFRLEFLPESLSLLGRLGLSVSLDVKPNPQVPSATALD